MVINERNKMKKPKFHSVREYKEKSLEALKYAESRTNGGNDAEGMSFVTPDHIEKILFLFDGNLKGINSLVLGCGVGSYAPIMPCALSYLGSNATGIDIQPIKDAKEKWGFNYKNMDLSEFSDEDPNYKTQFENKDLVIATGLDGHGMRDRYENTMSLTKELDKYFNLLRGIKEMNKKETLYFLGIPSLYQYQSHFLKNHNISADVIERTNPKFAKKFCDSKMKELGFNLLFKDKIKKNGFYKPIKD